MKETRTVHWNSPNTGETYESGFAGLTDGYRFNNGLFYFIGNVGFWWSSTEDYTPDALNFYLSSGNVNVVRWSHFRGSGFSVRCLRD